MGVEQEMTKGISEEQTLKEKKASTLWVEVAGACLGHGLVRAPGVLSGGCHGRAETCQ